MTKFLIILVNYQSDACIYQYIEMLLNTANFQELEIIITNNKAVDSVRLNNFCQRFTNIKILEPSQNLGYLGGAHFALRYYLETVKKLPQFVILSNPDIEIVDKDFFSQLSTIQEEAEVLGPQIISVYKGDNQNPFYKNRISQRKLKLIRFVTTNTALYTGYRFLFNLKKLLKPSFQDNNRTEAIRVYAVHGAFIIFRDTFFKNGGTLDYRLFLFGEEIYIAEMCRKFNMKMLYIPTLKVRHHEHQMTGTLKTKQLIGYLNQSIQFLLEDFFKNRLADK